MIKKTRVCNLLQITYPIIQGGLFWLSDANFASKVSECGALGVISPYGGMEKDGDPLENLKVQIKKMRNLTNKSFAVNIPYDLERAAEFILTAIEEKIPIIITSAGDPSIFTPFLKEKGIRVLHVVSNLKQAKKAEKAGVDILIVQGFEAAARIGLNEIPLFSLIPEVKDNVGIPIVASGGIVDARGAVAAFALGAEGIQIGTRLVATKESIAHPLYKKTIVSSSCSDTTVLLRGLSPRRVIKSNFAKKVLEFEKKSQSLEEILKFIGYRSSFDSQRLGNIEDGELYASSSVGIIKEILSVEEVIKEIVTGYKKILKEVFLIDD